LVKRSTDVQRAMTPGWRYLKYEGNRFSANLAVGDYIAWAFNPVRPQQRQFRDPGILANYYKIDAIAPPGTTLDEARLMLRKVLVDRLGLEYRFEDKPTLVRGKGSLKLTTASGPHQNPAFNSHGPASVTSPSASLADLAGFLSGYAGRPVIDKTGISGNFMLNLDWHVEMEAAMAEGYSIDPRSRSGR
jgi:uncharacterized protein (TIGR03435 family)